LDAILKDIAASGGVDYDRQAVITAALAANHPAADYIAQFMRGQKKTDWIK